MIKLLIIFANNLKRLIAFKQINGFNNFYELYRNFGSFCKFKAFDNFKKQFKMFGYFFKQIKTFDSITNMKNNKGIRRLYMQERGGLG